MSSWRLYFRYIAASLRGQMQYRASFVMMSVGQFAVTGIEIVGIWALFQRFGRLIDWSLPEVALFYGIVHIAFALSEALARGFDTFSTMVKMGEFDRLLVRPRSAAMQVAAQEWQLSRVGRLSQALIVLVWAAATLHLHVTPERLGLIVLAIVGGTCLFYGLFVLQATATFWSTETLELMNVLTYGGTETAQFPLSIYREWFRKLFTFVVPLACVAYFPVVTVLGREEKAFGTPWWFGWVAPLLGVAFMGVSLAIWRVGVRKYTSTGS